MSTFEERPLLFDCSGQQLIGIAVAPTRVHRRGLVLIVGGPQYRVGSHRQFTLLCRDLARQGIASLRFDYHGLGDSEGPPALGIEGLSGDIRCAIDAFLSDSPDVKEVMLWGLCGAASAAALYAPSDARVTALVMLNPWVRTEQGHAKTQLKHYYLARLSDPTFWRRIAGGQVNMLAALRGFARSVKRASGRYPVPVEPTISASNPLDSATSNGALPDRMLAALGQANVPVLVILSGNEDLTANEFRQLCAGSAPWKRWVSSPRVKCIEIMGATHTFSSADWRDQIASATLDWIRAP